MVSGPGVTVGHFVRKETDVEYDDHRRRKEYDYNDENGTEIPYEMVDEPEHRFH